MSSDYIHGDLYLKATDLEKLKVLKMAEMYFHPDHGGEHYRNRGGKAYTEKEMLVHYSWDLDQMLKIVKALDKV